ncbi:MAG TPA: YkgJ family cysteine cluster protein, partial [Thermoplasmata archaeon]|nr:YkgJ family cysteine cluster protein [Thermoplasmata archaeon]
MPLPPLDLSLVGGFRFRCRPDCGLCCFAEPAVTAAERGRLLRIEPELEVHDGERGWAYIAARPNGGACGLLTDLRCRAHAARPFPCAEFPVTVHVAERPQASVVLSCPGLDPAGLLRWANGPPGFAAPVGLDAELAATHAEWERTGTERELDRHRARYRGRGGVASIGAWRRAVHDALPWPEEADFPPEAPPELSDGAEGLPLTFTRRDVRIAFAGHPGGWELLSLSERGEEPRTLGVIPPPETPPPLTATGSRMLRSYLHYLVERDDAVDGVLAQAGPEGPIAEAVVADLVRTAATALGRA